MNVFLLVKYVCKLINGKEFKGVRDELKSQSDLETLT
jgi:hypothetical protein